MRISDWSSDVCSSDLALAQLRDQVRLSITDEGLRIDILDEDDFAMFDLGTNHLSPAASALLTQVASAVSALPNPVAMRGHTDSLPYKPRPGTAPEIGSASCRESVCQYVKISVVLVSLKKKRHITNK